MRNVKSKARTRFLLIGLTVSILIVAAVGYWISASLGAMGSIVKGAHSYQPYAEKSSDGRYVLQTIKFEDESGVGAGFQIETPEGQTVWKCPDRYRVYDLYYMNWVPGTLDIYVDSHDIGAFLYRCNGTAWIREDSNMGLFAEDSESNS